MMCKLDCVKTEASCFIVKSIKILFALSGCSEVILRPIVARNTKKIHNSICVIVVNSCVSHVQPYSRSNRHVIPDSTTVAWKYSVSDLYIGIGRNGCAQKLAVVNVRESIPGL